MLFSQAVSSAPLHPPAAAAAAAVYAPVVSTPDVSAPPPPQQQTAAAVTQLSTQAPATAGHMGQPLPQTGSNVVNIFVH